MVTIKILKCLHSGFQYQIEERQERPQPPELVIENPTLNRAAIFDVFLGGAVRFECPHPFAVFFRYGKPDVEHGTPYAPDYLRQLRGRKVGETVEDRKVVEHWAVTVRTDRSGTYSPLIAVYKKKDQDFFFDHGLWFEVHQWGT